MTGIGVAVEELNQFIGALHASVVDKILHEHCAHGNRTVIDGFSRGDNVWNNAQR